MPHTSEPKICPQCRSASLAGKPRRVNRTEQAIVLGAYIFLGCVGAVVPIGICDICNPNVVFIIPLCIILAVLFWWRELRRKPPQTVYICERCSFILNERSGSAETTEK